MNHPASPAPQSACWKICSICKTDLPFEGDYMQCSVSTCQRKRTALYFCSLPCFEAHLPTARHRDAWAEQQKAPTRQAWLQQQALEKQSSADSPETPGAPLAGGARRIVGAPQTPASNDVLVVVSKLKKFVKDTAGMNTSDTAIGPLSDHLREVCRRAIDVAQRDGRRTVLDRDIRAALRGE